MGWLEGVLTGYADRHYQIQRDKMAEAQKAAEREEKVYQTLLQSPYSDIQNYAAAGILDLANPRRRAGGVAGWMGEVEKGPYLDMVMRAKERIGSDPEYAASNLRDPFYSWQAADQPLEEGGAPPPTPSIPSPAGQVAPAPAGSPSAALPSTAVTTGGPMTPAAPPPPPPGGAPQMTAAPPPQPPSPYSTWSKFTHPGPGGADIYGQDPYARGPGFSPGYAQAAPQGYGVPPEAGAPPDAGQGGPPAPAVAIDPATGQPVPPAGPPLQVSAGPPPAPGLVADGQPGATTRPVGRPRPVRPSRTQLPNIFPTAGDLLQQRERAEITGQVQGWQMLYRQMGDPDWEQKGLQAVLDQKRRGAGLGGTLKEGNLRQQPDGSWVQDLYDPYTGALVNTIPSQGPLGSGTVQETERLAFELYGRQGENPRETIRRLSPTAMARVDAEMRHRKAVQAAEIALARAEAMADAPLTAQAKSQLIETLNSKWQRLQVPIRETQRQFNAMLTGLKAYREGNPASGVEMIRVAFERILDPTSVVREGEYARQVDGLPLTSRMQGFIDSLAKGGGRIPEHELAGMVETARQFLETLQGWNDVEAGRIEDRATAHNIDPGFIFGGGVRKPPPPPNTKASGAASAGSGTSTGGINLDSDIVMGEDGKYQLKKP